MILTVPGISCEHCVRRISQALSALEGVTDVAIDLNKKSVTITGNVDRSTAIEAITKAGYTVQS